MALGRFLSPSVQKSLKPGGPAPRHPPQLQQDCTEAQRPLTCVPLLGFPLRTMGLSAGQGKPLSEDL